MWLRGYSSHKLLNSNIIIQWAHLVHGFAHHPFGYSWKTHCYYPHALWCISLAYLQSYLHSNTILYIIHSLYACLIQYLPRYCMRTIQNIVQLYFSQVLELNVALLF